MLIMDMHPQTVPSLFLLAAFHALELLPDLPHFLGAFFEGVCCVGRRLSHALS